MPGGNPGIMGAQQQYLWSRRDLASLAGWGAVLACFAAAGGAILRLHPKLCELMTYATLAMELGFPIMASVRVRPGMGQLRKIPQIAQESPEVVECHRITGEDCYLLSVRLRVMDDLEEVLDRFTLHGQTTTSIVHSTPVARRVPLIDEDAG